MLLNLGGTSSTDGTVFGVVNRDRRVTKVSQPLHPSHEPWAGYHDASSPLLLLESASIVIHRGAIVTLKGVVWTFHCQRSGHAASQHWLPLCYLCLTLTSVQDNTCHQGVTYQLYYHLTPQDFTSLPHGHVQVANQSSADMLIQEQ